MASLVVTCLDDSGSPKDDVLISASLSDSLGRPLQEFTTTGILVGTVYGYTGDDGICVLDLVPNTSILRDNTYYSVKVGTGAPRLILKTSSTQAFVDALVVTPAALGPAALLDALGDVDVGSAIAGDVLRLNVAGDAWEPYSLPSGSVPSYIHNQGAAATVWIVNHGLNRHPVMDVLDSSGREMMVQIDHNSLNQATVTLLSALTGTVECR